MFDLLLLLIAYLLGSLSSAVVVCKLLQLPDPRSEGSGNPGATNVLRIGGKKAAALVLVGDVAKGIVAVLLAKLIGLSLFATGFVMCAVILGHIFPVFFGFKGGKGVATGLGALLVLAPLLALVVIAIWFAVFYFTRYSSLAALCGFACAPVLSLWLASPVYLFALMLSFVMIAWRHYPNIVRLLDGQEPKSKLF